MHKITLFILQEKEINGQNNFIRSVRNKQQSTVLTSIPPESELFC